MVLYVYNSSNYLLSLPVGTKAAKCTSIARQGPSTGRSEWPPLQSGEAGCTTGRECCAVRAGGVAREGEPGGECAHARTSATECSP